MGQRSTNNMPSPSNEHSSAAGMRQSTLSTQLEHEAQGIGSSALIAAPSQSCVPTEFKLFPKLPIELRLKVWGYHMQVPRIIEMRFSDWSDRYGLKVTKEARRPPAILQVNQEAREEAEKVYTVRTFDTAWSGSTSRILYYNPEADLVQIPEIFDDTTTVVKLFSQGPIHRIVFDLDESWGAQDFLPGQLFHNISKGLKEIYFVVPSNLNPNTYGIEHIDPDVGIRPAGSNGLDYDEQRGISQLLRLMQNIKNSLQRKGLSPTQDTLSPGYQFITWCPQKGMLGLTYESIAFEKPDVGVFNSLASGSHPDIKAVEKKTGCVVKFPGYHHSYRHHSVVGAVEEVGFIGMKSVIEEAKKVVIALVKEAGAGELIELLQA